MNVLTPYQRTAVEVAKATRLWDLVVESAVERMYVVPSTSGEFAAYRVTLTGPHTYECNCPAGERGRACKHAAAVAIYRLARAGKRVQRRIHVPTQSERSKAYSQWRAEHPEHPAPGEGDQAGTGPVSPPSTPPRTTPSTTNQPEQGALIGHIHT